jgi:DNA-directed RNA polymerase subunit F
MIKNIEPVSMAEVKKILSEMKEKAEEKEKNKELQAYLKKFTKLSKEEAEKLKKDLTELGLLKLKKEHIIKIIDMMPRDASDVRKIFTDIMLDENEISQILETVKKYL